MNSQELIHDKTTIYDFNYDRVSTPLLLRRIQYWKEYFTVHEIKSIGLHYYQCVNSIAILFACLEKSVTIRTCAYSDFDVDNIIDQVDLIIIGQSKKEMHRPADSKFVLIDDLLKIDGPDYTPSDIDLDHVIIDNGDLTYTANSLILSAQTTTHFYCVNQPVATIQYTSHVGTLALFFLSPVLAGASIYSCAHLIDMASLLYKGLVSVVGLYPLHLHALMLIEKNINKESPFGQSSFGFKLNECTVMIPGTTPPPEVCEWALLRGANRIKVFYGVAELAMPCFVVDIGSPNFDFNARELGAPLPKVQYRLNSDNQLLVKSPGTNKTLDFDAQGWYNTKDYVIVDNNKLLFKGRDKINNQYLVDVQNFICGLIENTGIGFSDFSVFKTENGVEIHSYRIQVHDALLDHRDLLETELMNFDNISRIEFNYVDKSQIWKI